MPPQLRSKAYVIVVDLGTAGTEPAPDGNGTVSTGGMLIVKYIVLTPANIVTAAESITSGGFSYGDSDQAIRESVAASVRARENDPLLDVTFVTGG